MAERDDSSESVDVVEDSFLAKDAELQVAKLSAGELQAKHEVMLRQMPNAAGKASRLESNI